MTTKPTPQQQVAKRYEWAREKCPGQKVHERSAIRVHMPTEKAPWGEEVRCLACNGAGYVPLPDAELMAQVMGRLEADGWDFWMSAGDYKEIVLTKGDSGLVASSPRFMLPDNPTIEQRIHAMTQAACAALMEVQ